MNYEQFTMNHELKSPIHQFFNSLIISAFGVVNLGNIYLSNQFNLGNLWLKFNLSAVASAKADQSKITNYAKQSQFFKKSNVYNINKYSELQRKNENGHLVKTNPNKPNLARRSLGEGGFIHLPTKGVKRSSFWNS
jgi:hypothetical protein